MSLLSKFRETSAVLPDILLREAGAAFGVFVMIWLPPLLLFSADARRTKRFPFYPGYMLRIIILVTIIVAGAVFFTGRTVTSPAFVLGVLDMTIGANRLDPRANINRAATIISTLPAFTIQNGSLITDVPEEGITLYDTLLHGGKRSMFIHITDKVTDGATLFPGNDDHTRPTIILHKKGMALKQGDGAYEESAYATLEHVSIGETEILSHISDITPPAGGYSVADILRLIGKIAEYVAPTQFIEDQGFSPISGNNPAKASFYTLPGEDASPRIYIDLTPAAVYPKEDSTFLLVITDKLALWRARTDDPFNPVFLPSLSRAYVYNEAGNIMRSVQHVLTFYFWPVIVPLCILLATVCIMAPAMLIARITAIITRCDTLTDSYTGSAALCIAAIAFYVPVFSFAGLWDMYVTLALGVLFYMILCYTDIRAYRRLTR